MPTYMVSQKITRKNPVFIPEKYCSEISKHEKYKKTKS
jgi:hypothetical protein